MESISNWSKILIKVSDSLQTAIKVLDAGGLQIALVVDNQGKLLGTMTDGDIRRALIKQLGMDCLVGEIMNNHPVTALESSSRTLIISKMKSSKLSHMPLVDENNTLTGLETMRHLTSQKKYDNPVFLMAGGLGSRLHPLTEETPKPLLKIGNRPILETILVQFAQAGFYNFFISTHFKAEKIKEYFGNGSDWNVNISYIDEKKPLGTAGSLGLLPKKLPKIPIVMMNGDILTKINFEQLLNFHEKQEGDVTMCTREHAVEVPFGVVDVHNQKARSIIEKPIKKFFVNAGIYVLSSELVSQVNHNEHMDMPFFLEKQINKGKIVNVFPIYEYWLDIGHMKSYKQANQDIDALFSQLSK
jgi:dTDP-glucose pyrophosphorylase/CBS domain-containing protein